MWNTLDRRCARTDYRDAAAPRDDDGQDEQCDGHDREPPADSISERIDSPERDERLAVADDDGLVEDVEDGKIVISAWDLEKCEQ